MNSDPEKRGGKEPTPPATPLEIYRRAIQVADEDSVHEVIVRQGPEVLRKGLPYVVVAARWQRASMLRGEARHQRLLDDHAVDLSREGIRSPLDQVSEDHELRALAHALAELKDIDVIVLWDSVSGDPDETIAKKLVNLGLAKQPPSPNAIRQMRHRALQRVKKLLIARLEKPPDTGGA